MNENSRSERQNLLYKADNVRDSAFVSSRKFIWDTGSPVE